MKDYVEIQSSISIVVTPGLLSENVTDYEAHIPERLRINPKWQSFRILIKRGKHVYPSFITEWGAVKDLIKEDFLTIGRELDTCNDAEMVEKAKEIKEELDQFKKTVKDISLDEVASNGSK